MADDPGDEGESIVYVANTNGTGLTVLATDGWDSFLSGDSSRVAFRNLEGIFVINTDGTGLSLVTDSGFSPSLSRDGSLMAFVCTPSPTQVRNICVVNTDGTGLAQLISNQECALSDASSNFLPSLSGDGLRVAFATTCNLTGHNFDGGAEVFIINTDGTGLTQLTHAPFSGK
jgi:Tol biopolymer transport system component